MYQGQLPYRDFFEHHMPGIQYFLALAMNRLHPTTADELIHFAFVGRLLMWPFAVVSVLLTMRLGSSLGGSAVAWIAGALLTTSVVFLGRTLEIRPDTPALACWCGTLATLVVAVTKRHAGSRRRWFVAAGLLLGCALAFNQKLLLAGPGLAVFAGWWVLTPGSSRRSNFCDIIAFGTACALPLFALALWFWEHGALIDLVNGSVVNNLGWPQEVSAASTIRWMLLRDPIFSAIAVAGLVDASLTFASEPSRDPISVPLVLTALSLLAGLAITPAPYPQYMLLVMPIGAAVGAELVWKCLSRVSMKPGDHSAAAISRRLAVAAGILVVVIGLLVAKPVFMNPAVYPLFVLAAGTTGWLALRHDRPSLAAAACLVICSAYSLQQIRWMQDLSNAESVAEMRFVSRATSPVDTVLDGFTGVAWFRSSATRIPFFHAGVRAQLTPAARAMVVEALEACPGRPRLVILDSNLRAVSPLVTPAVTRNYERTRFPMIWTAKESCAP